MLIKNKFTLNTLLHLIHHFFIPLVITFIFITIMITLITSLESFSYFYSHSIAFYALSFLNKWIYYLCTLLWIVIYYYNFFAVNKKELFIWGIKKYMSIVFVYIALMKIFSMFFWFYEIHIYKWLYIQISNIVILFTHFLGLSGILFLNFSHQKIEKFLFFIPEENKLFQKYMIFLFYTNILILLNSSYFLSKMLNLSSYDYFNELFYPIIISFLFITFFVLFFWLYCKIMYWKYLKMNWFLLPLLDILLILFFTYWFFSLLFLSSNI